MSRTVAVPADPNVDPGRYDPRVFRFLEIVPGGLAWAALLLPFLVAPFAPLAVTGFIIVFDCYWFVKAMHFSAILWRGHRAMRRAVRTDWASKVRELRGLSAETLEENGLLHPDDVYHAVLVPTYKEELATLRTSIRSIAAAEYRMDRMIVCLATEQRDQDNARRNAAALREEFGDSFALFIVTEHPDGVVGEVKAKGANASFAAKELVRRCGSAGIRLEDVVVSTADADTCFPSYYFSALTVRFCLAPDRRHAAFQPVATFFNNIWSAPMISRVLAFNTTFWQLSESVRPHRLLTFSTHAISLATLVDMDYWCTSIVNEDSRQFFRAFFRYGGNFRVIPLFIPVYMDAVLTGDWKGTVRNLYFQQQRWAYGVEHFPYIVMEGLRHPEIPFLSRLALVWRAFQGGFSWSTTAFYLAVVGWLPGILNSGFKLHVASAQFPLVTSWLLRLTWLGILVIGYVMLAILPPRPGRATALSFFGMLAQWILLPISTIAFSAVPGLDAQTRLMLGKYLGFRVTEKKAVPAPV